MSNFSERLKELMEDKNLNASQLENETGCSNPNILSWIKFGTSPLLPSLLILADYFKCSIEFLSGRTDESSYTKNDTSTTFAERLNFLKTTAGLSYNFIGKAIGVESTQFTRWTRGAMPTLNNLNKLADYFGCSLDYLVGREN